MPTEITRLEHLYRELGPSLLSYFRQQRVAPAEDLLQETFLRAARHPERLDRAVSPRGYLFGIARFVRLDALRQAPPPQELLPDVAGPAPDPGSDRLDAMRAAIGALPEAQRETLLLKLQQELSYEEIAHVLAIPVGTVRSRLHHAVAQLKQALNPSSLPRP